MVQKSSVTRRDTRVIDQPEAPGLWGFRRRAMHEAAAAPAAAPEDAPFTADALAEGFETFGRGGLELGGLHRDQQWVGAWGGRC